MAQHIFRLRYKTAEFNLFLQCLGGDASQSGLRFSPKVCGVGLTRQNFEKPGDPEKQNFALPRSRKKGGGMGIWKGCLLRESRREPEVNHKSELSTDEGKRVR